MHGCVAAMCREHPLETKRGNNISIKAKSPHVAAIITTILIIITTINISIAVIMT